MFYEKVCVKARRSLLISADENKSVPTCKPADFYNIGKDMLTHKSDPLKLCIKSIAVGKISRHLLRTGK